jgi:hypothetical protein
MNLVSYIGDVLFIIDEINCEIFVKEQVYHGILTTTGMAKGIRSWTEDILSLAIMDVTPPAKADHGHHSSWIGYFMRDVT